MKILVVGSGAREHALAWKLAAERAVSGVLCAPGNPGIAAVARCVEGDVANPRSLLEIAARESVDLTVVGPELPLSLGVVDLFAAERRAIVGPSRAAAALESSKAFAKDVMRRHGVPTAAFEVCDSAAAAYAVIASGALGYPLVLKADGLAAGKGVVIAPDRAGAEDAVRRTMVDRRFGAAGDRIVLEECLVGEEASYFVLADGTACMPLTSAQDHKRIFDGDRGPNTGGMGAFAPAPRLTPEMERRVLRDIVQPVLEAMAEEGYPFRGFLYVGLMLTASGPRVVEFNVRLGDPEAQVLLPRFDEDLSSLLSAAAAGALPSRAARFRREPHVGVVLAAAGYPDSVETGRVITGLDDAARVPDALVFHAATQRQHGTLVTAGGRVLTVVGHGTGYGEAIDVAYRAASHIRFEGMQFRRDIGRKALDAEAP
ncbi:MAG: phosphoribosylamine--glycine ligase [Acidobacteria bacterium]|nr:phosphoribosylamine--glycine ligase [Acidobacteriota bacterium]